MLRFLACVDFLAFIVTDDVELVLAGLIDKVRRLVHVVPDSGDAVVGVSAMQVAPPAARFRQSVIDKHTVARPDSRHKQIAIATALEVVFLQALIEGVIASRCQLSRFGCLTPGSTIVTTFTPCRPVSRSSALDRKRSLIEGEDAIAVHVIDVEMNHVERQIAFAILVHNFFDHRVGIIAPAALLITQRPERRQRHVAGEIGITAEDLFDRWPIERSSSSSRRLQRQTTLAAATTCRNRNNCDSCCRKRFRRRCRFAVRYRTGWFDRSDLCLQCNRVYRNSS